MHAPYICIPMYKNMYMQMCIYVCISMSLYQWAHLGGQFCHLGDIENSGDRFGV